MNIPQSKDVAVITGGGGFLGFQHAIALIELGVCVCLIDINQAALDSASLRLKNLYPSSKIYTFVCDITSESAVENVVSEIEKQLNRVDILINNASIDHVPGSLEKLDNSFENFSLQQWNLELAVGLTGTFLTSKYVGQVMRKSRKGVILNIASDLSVISPDQRIYQVDGAEIPFYKPITYSAIKSGILGITRYLATYWAPFGIRVNALSPGGVSNNQPVEFQKKLINLIPMNRMAQPDEYQGAVQFLCSDMSKYMTGQNIVIDGGRTVW